MGRWRGITVLEYIHGSLADFSDGMSKAMSKSFGAWRQEKIVMQWMLWWPANTASQYPGQLHHQPRALGGEQVAREEVRSQKEGIVELSK